MSLRFRVVRAIPVLRATSRWESPAASMRLETSAAIAADAFGGCSIWSTVVPTWNTRKRKRGQFLFHFWYLRDPCRYFEAMSDNRQERSPWSDATSAQIRAERAAAGWTQAKMVELSGVKRSTYLRLEKGQRVPNITDLARICAALGMPLSEFLRRVEARKPEDGNEGPPPGVDASTPQPV